MYNHHGKKCFMKVKKKNAAHLKQPFCSNLFKLNTVLHKTCRIISMLQWFSVCDSLCGKIHVFTWILIFIWRNFKKLVACISFDWLPRNIRVLLLELGSMISVLYANLVIQCLKEFCVFGKVFPSARRTRVTHHHHMWLFRFFINTSSCGEEQLFPHGTSDI